MVIREQRAIVLDKVEQIRHLLQIRRNVGVVAREMRIVELDADDVLNVSLRRIEMTTIVCRLAHGSRARQRPCSERKEHRYHHASRHDADEAISQESFHGSLLLSYKIALQLSYKFC